MLVTNDIDHQDFIYNVAVMGENRTDNTSFIHSLLKSQGQSVSDFVDIFAVDLVLNREVTLECKFLNTMQNLEGLQTQSFGTRRRLWCSMT